MLNKIKARWKRIKWGIIYNFLLLGTLFLPWRSWIVEDIKHINTGRYVAEYMLIYFVIILILNLIKLITSKRLVTIPIDLILIFLYGALAFCNITVSGEMFSGMKNANIGYYLNIIILIIACGNMIKTIFRDLLTRPEDDFQKENQQEELNKEITQK